MFKDKKSTLSVPWWPAVSSLSETLLRDTALMSSRGSSEVFVVDYPWPWRYKKKSFLLFFSSIVRFWGTPDTDGCVHCILAFDVGCVSLSAHLPHKTHYKNPRLTFPLEKPWVNKMCQKPPMHYQLKLYEWLWEKNKKKKRNEHAVRILWIQLLSVLKKDSLLVVACSFYWVIQQKQTAVLTFSDLFVLKAALLE